MPSLKTITTTRRFGFVVSDTASATYQQACREVALKWAIPFLDMEGDSQIPAVTGKRPLQVEKYGIAVDSRVRTLRWNSVFNNNSHPNAVAHLWQSYFIENWLRSL